MLIRAALPSDLPELMAFYDEMCDLMGQRPFLPNGSEDAFPSRAMVSAAIEAGEQFLALEEDVIAGAYILNHECDGAYDTAPWQVEADPAQVVIVHALRILPRFGGRGYSRQLMEHALRTAREWGMRAVRLDVLEGNEVPEQMYYRMGFRYVHTVPITYPDIGRPMPFRLLEYLL